MAQKLNINLLGSLELLQDGQPVAGLASRKAEALLAYLACNPRPHARDALAALLWDDRPQQRALANLSVLLSSLRKQLDLYFTAGRQEISINLHSPYTLDTAVFESQILTARRQIHEQGHASRSAAMKLENALRLYRHDFLAGFYVRDASGFEEWAMMERERLRRLAIEALDTLVNFHLERGKYKTGIEYAARLVMMDPLREESHRQLMRLLAASGRRNAALEQYDDCCHILEEELGVSPTDDTTQLFHAIRRGELEINATVSAARHNLPAPTTSFIGRDRELAQIRQRLVDPACRLLTLAGPGGSGKTRLLLEAARQQLGEFLDGVWFTPLASLSDGAFLETAVAQAIDFSFTGNEAPRAQLLAYLRQKEMLLALDSFEHLLDGAGVDFIADLLVAAPEVKLLVSSRERLGLQAEWLQEIDGLPYPATNDDGRLPSYGAVQLFVQRAGQVSGDFELTPENAPVVAQICRLTAGMPLGLELAAAGVRHYRCADIAAALSENIDFLSVGQRDAPPRHRSLRAAIDHSWRLLSTEEQQAFAALSVFGGSFSLDAALDVLQTTPATLHALVDKSLLQRERNGRFQLHNLLRQYAADKLAEMPAQAAVMRRHGSCYARFLRQRRADLKGGRQLAALEEIEAEIENVRAAWRTAQSLPLQTPQLIPMIGDTVQTLFHFYTMRSWFREGAAMLKQAVAWLAPAESADAQLLQAQLRARYGWLAYLLGDVETGTAALQESMAILEAQDDKSNVVFCLNYLGAIAYYQNDLELAQRYLQRSLALATGIEDKHGEAIARNVLGVVHLALDDLEEAEALLQASLALKRQIEDRWGIAFSLESLGRIDVALGRQDVAEKRYRESLAIREEIGDRRGTALCLQQLGELAALKGDAAAAGDLYTQCLEILQEIGAAHSQERVRRRLVTLEEMA